MRNEQGAQEFRAALRAACEAAGGQKEWARAHGVSAAYVNDVLHGRRDGTDRIAAPLGWEVVTVYRRRPPTGKE